MKSVLAGLLCLLLGSSGVAGAADMLRDGDHELNPRSPDQLLGGDTMLKTADGTGFGVYATGPEDATRGILLIHEWWGLNDHIRAWADRFARLGYRAYAIDLYGGGVATDPDTARSLMKAVNQPEANAKMTAALESLAVPGRKLATIGWCFGGGQSLQASLAAPERVDATVIYYGPLVADPEALKKLRGPVLGIFATQDQSINPDKVAAFEQAMQAAGKRLEVHSYDANHAFANPSGQRYNGEAAVAAWQVTREFLDREL